MTIVSGHDPADPDFHPLNEWRHALWKLGYGMAPLAALYWHTHERAINRLRLFRDIRLQTVIYVQRFVNAGAARCSMPPIAVYRGDPIPFKWAERDVEFRNQAEALYSDLRCCRLTDHALRAEIFAAGYGWLGDEYVKAWEMCENDSNQAVVKIAVGDILGWIKDSHAVRDAAQRVADPALQFDRINDAVLALDDRMKDLEPRLKRSGVHRRGCRKQA